MALNHEGIPNVLSNSPVRQLIFLESQEFEKKTSKSSASERKRKEAISESTVKSQRIGITLKLEITDVL